LKKDFIKEAPDKATDEAIPTVIKLAFTKKYPWKNMKMTYMKQRENAPSETRTRTNADMIATE